MTIQFNLTKKQTRALRKHFEMVGCAADVGKRGCFVAQVCKDNWDEVAYVRAHFISGERCQPIYDAISKAKLPNGYLGIPLPVAVGVSEP